METSDGLQSTPLLLACMGGNLDTVKLLVEAGAKITKLNLQRHGVVELSAFRVYVDILHYLTELGDDIIQAWKLLVGIIVHHNLNNKISNSDWSKNATVLPAEIDEVYQLENNDGHFV